MWRRSSISSASSASRARRYSALSLGNRKLLARASSAAGFRAGLLADFWVELLMAGPRGLVDFDVPRLEDVLEGGDPTRWRNIFCASSTTSLRGALATKIPWGWIAA